ncbi:MAG TPA: ABC transporter ATP-binding protein [Xanthobacteraceae bacterium]|nr:ABC transporter ATP-binding protein [Xanthobacteraceae bacterium]
MSAAAHVSDGVEGSSTPQSGISIAGIDVTYGVGTPEAVAALEGIDLEISEGSFVSLVGPSGCGKSTLLKVVADLMPPTRGHIRIGGEPPQELRRTGRIGLVFQQANLMPWLRVTDNVRLLNDLVAGGAGRPVRKRDVSALLDVVGLQGFENKRPHQLSGGMQQRVALARALALDPAILLMDEPFAALDEITRDRMAFELMRIWHVYRKTVMFVTHSLAEAVFLSDRVILMTARPGRIHKIFDIDLPRPRDRETRFCDRYLRLVGEVNRELYRVMS